MRDFKLSNNYTIIQFHNTKDVVINLFLDNEFVWFKGENKVKNLVDYLGSIAESIGEMRKMGYLEVDNHLIIHTPNLTIFFLVLVRKIKDVEDLFKTEIVNFNGEVYKIKLTARGGVEIIIRCVEKTIPDFYTILGLREEEC